jgi:hypothetical protein
MSKDINGQNNSLGGESSMVSNVATSKSLTGIWRANDGGTYYMHHIEEDDTVWWIGTSKEGGDMPWMGVYHGKIDKDENVIDGTWAAVPITIIGGKWSPLPKGEMHGEGHGRLKLRIIYGRDESIFLTRMPEEHIGETGGYGGTSWEQIS